MELDAPRELPQDPFDWSVDDVVHYLCYSSFDAWTVSRASPPRPDPLGLEKSLRENDINGEALLTEIDKHTLSQDFNINSIGKRMTIYRAIEYLRKCSAKFEETGFHFTAAATPSLFVRRSQETSSPGNRFDTPQRLVGFLPSQQSPVAVRAAASTPLPLPPLLPPPPKPAAAEPKPDAPQEDAAVSEHVTTEPVANDPVTTGLAPKPPQASIQSRQNNHVTVGEGGKKRRRLNPVVAPLPPPWQSSDEGEDWYLGPKKLAAPDVFYDISNAESDNDKFCFSQPATIPTGKRRFVMRQMQHYFQQPLRPVTKNGKEAFALFPYDNISKGLTDVKTYFTLFSKHESGSVTAKKEDLKDWPELGDTPNNGFGDLLRRYPPEDDQEDALPVYGDSGSEGGYDSETWREIDADVEQALQINKTLSSAEIGATIDSCINEFVETWRSTRLPTEERKAARMWTRSRMKRTTNTDIKVAASQVAYLNQRLKKLQQAIHDNTWLRVEDVKQICRSMEKTVFDRELQKWKTSVFELEKCPQKPTNPPPKQPPKTAKRQSKLPADEESLYSDSAHGSEDDMDDFIAPDDPVITSDDPFVTQADAHGKMGAVMSPKMPLPPPSPSQADGNDEDEPLATPRIKRKLFRSVSDGKTLFINDILSPKTPQSSTKQASPNGIMSSAQKGRPSFTIPPDIEFVDLTRCDDEEEVQAQPGPSNKDGIDNGGFEVHTPPLNPNRAGSDPPTQYELAPQISAAELTNHKYIDEVLSTPWSLLEERLDRKGLLIKHVYSIFRQEFEEIRQLFKQKSRKRWKNWIRDGLEALSNDMKMMPKLQERRSHLVLRVTTWFISWINCKKLGEGIPKSYIKKAKTGIPLNQFCPELQAALQLAPNYSSSEIMTETKPSSSLKHMDKNQKLLQPSPVLLDASDNEDNDSIQDDDAFAKNRAPHKKRKRAVKQSQEAMDTQRSAQRRVEQQVRQQQRLAKKLDRMGVGNSHPERQAISFDDPVIYLDPHIGRRVKPHQLNGIQFMWRELIKDEKHQGCLLAHTMGLGKTMQVISLLVTIANAGKSDNPEVRSQVPKHLQRSRTLVMCPSSLIENWWDEFHMWVPHDGRSAHNLGQLRKILPSVSPNERWKEVSDWYTHGGVLIISYDLFRAAVLNRATQNRPAPLSAATHAKVKKHLLEGPNIIVADEAHKMKNRSSGIAEASRGFVSKSRIALTGSPLANNLADYYAMIDWISPGYLGDFVQFKAKYIEPIEEGLFADSSRTERRASLKKLEVLKKDIEPKVNRHDISALKGSLPPKVEFLITAPLTDLQKRAYEKYVSFLLDGAEVGNTKLWIWLNILSLICSHPSCFMAKLLKEKAKQKPPSAQSQLSPGESESEEMTTADDAPVSQALPQKARDELEEILNSVPDLESSSLSHRARILDNIIRESVKVGEKVLVFSHNILSLNYIQGLMDKANVKYHRLDGTTKVGTRQESTKNFNRDPNLFVYLISTRAGGLGLNIPGANRVILFDFGFNPTWEEQAVGRAYRLGQGKPVFVYRFLSGGTFETAMHNKAVFKEQLASRVVDKKNPIRWASRKNKDYLFVPKEVEQIDLSEFKGKDPVLDAILSKEKFIRKIELTETFKLEDYEPLTAEEQMDVQAQLEEEQMKRNNPAEWKKLDDRRKIEQLRQEEENRAKYSSWSQQQQQQAQPPFSSNGPPAARPTPAGTSPYMPQSHLGIRPAGQPLLNPPRLFTASQQPAPPQGMSNPLRWVPQKPPPLPPDRPTATSLPYPTNESRPASDGEKAFLQVSAVEKETSTKGKSDNIRGGQQRETTTKEKFSNVGDGQQKEIVVPQETRDVGMTDVPAPADPPLPSTGTSQSSPNCKHQ